MAFIDLDNGAYVSVGFSQAGQTFSNGFWCTKTSYTLTDQQNLAAAVDAAVDASVLTGLSNEVTYVNTKVYDMRTETGAIVVNSDNTGVGTITASPAPIGLACVVTIYSAARGKSGRGRLYISGLTEDALEDGQWLQTAADGCEAFVAAYKAAIESAGFTYVVCSRFTAGAARTHAVAYPVTSYLVRSNIPGAQRRRFDRP